MDITKTVKPARNSNLELFRIITMLLIIAHHYVVNSGLTSIPNVTDISVKNMFLWIFGAYGKIGINCFVLITGYFMCKSRITLGKFLKLILEVEFYKIVIYIIFLATGVVEFSLVGLVKTILPFTSVAQNFTGCFLIFYLCIPFLNILIKNLDEKMHIRLLAISIFTYVIVASIPKFSVTMNYVSWYIILYFIASYIRLYPKKIFDNTLFWGIMAIVSFLLSACSVIACLALKHGTYFFVSDSNKLLAVITGLSMFMFFKNINIKTSKIVNAIGSTCFGVLLIHANSETMRNWLWKTTLNNVEKYYSDYFYLHAILSVLAIFIICSLIDLVRIHFIEKPFFKWWNKIENKITEKYQNIENKICKKLGIGEKQ